MAIALLGLSATACLPDPARVETGQIYDQLVSTRGMLIEQPSRFGEACPLLGAASTRLYGEPGLADIKPLWSELQNTAYALQAVCGENILLAQPSTGSLTVEAARDGWRLGIQRELGVACDHLRSAATALDRTPPC